MCGLCVMRTESSGRWAWFIYTSSPTLASYCQVSCDISEHTALTNASTTNVILLRRDSVCFGGHLALPWRKVHPCRFSAAVFASSTDRPIDPLYLPYFSAVERGIFLSLLSHIVDACGCEYE